jgi:hypothetical protein
VLASNRALAMNKKLSRNPDTLTLYNLWPSASVAVPKRSYIAILVPVPTCWSTLVAFKVKISVRPSNYVNSAELTTAV